MISREIAEDLQIKTIYRVTWEDGYIRYHTADELTIICESSFRTQRTFKIQTLTYKEYLDMWYAK